MNLDSLKRSIRLLNESRKPGALVFRCNICGTRNCARASTVDREGGACCECGANVRFRSVAAALTQRLFGQVEILDELPAKSAMQGIGMSDAPHYASRLESKFAYANTFFHCEPLLDITRPDARWIGRNDFVISSDVFEHVPPPVQRAFDNLYTLLKPGGVAIFSVPFSTEGETREHFPNLCKFSIREEAQGKWVLDNVTANGTVEQFRDLVFHGGPGQTLEMRLFSLSALRRHFEAAGFVDLKVHGEPLFEYGIFFLHPWSLVLSAVRPPL